MKNWPSWLPNPNSWLSALVLIVLLGGFLAAIPWLMLLLQFISHFSPKLAISLWFCAYLSPIVFIAAIHHLSHKLLDRYFPQTRSPAMDKVEGWLPSLMSWWEGLYGWLAIVLALLVSNALLIVFSPTSPLANPHLLDFTATQMDGKFLLTTLVRLVCAAYLYHFESLVRQHFMAMGASDR